MIDYVDSFSDDQLRELRDNAARTFQEVYLTVADVPKIEWPVVRINHLRELRERIADYEGEIARRSQKQASATAVPTAAGIGARPEKKSGRRARIFISYAHADEPYKKTLERHLALLERIGLIETWSDRELAPGQKWEAEIGAHLQSADVVVLLVSANFLASDYSYDKEMTPALERLTSDAAVVIPIILSPSDWKPAPFANLQALPENAKPITTWANQDEAWTDVASGIRRVIQKLGLGE